MFAGFGLTCGISLQAVPELFELGAESGIGHGDHSFPFQLGVDVFTVIAGGQESFDLLPGGYELRLAYVPAKAFRIFSHLSDSPFVDSDLFQRPSA